MKDVTMPKLSDTMTEGTVVAWRKEVGATVERGEVIAEVETDKATMELEAFAAGVLLEIRVAAGETVPVGTVIGLIGKAGEQPPARKGSSEGKEPAEEKKSAEEKSAPEEQGRAGEKGEAAAETAGEAGASGEVRAAPVVRRRARELGLDLEAMRGSGPDGRVLLEDLERAGTKSGAAPAAEAEAEAKPQSRMRAAIARTVSESWRTIPHFSVTMEVRMEAAEAFRKGQKQGEPAVSLNALLIKAAALALDQFPLLNASLREEGVVRHPEINIGIVVRRDDGLLVPVLHDCAKLSLTETAERTAQLVEQARAGKLGHTALSGGTFAISNLGMFGVDSFVALILPPMAAVLAVGSVRDGVVVKDGKPAVGRLLSLTLSADHRLVDGAYAAEFLQVVRQLLENPAELGGE